METHQEQWAVITVWEALVRRRTEVITLLLTIAIYGPIIRLSDDFIWFATASLVVGVVLGRWWATGAAVGVFTLGLGHPSSVEKDLLWELIVFGYLPLAAVLIAAGVALRRLVERRL
jgi:hypothetical protein